MPLLQMQSDGVTNCSQKLLHVARTIAVAEEIARDKACGMSKLQAVATC